MNAPELPERLVVIARVTAEYDHGYSAARKNAIDYVHHEWH
jgi:NAD(P)H-dependent FMN reductase